MPCSETTIQNCLHFVMFIGTYDRRRRGWLTTISYWIGQHWQKFDDMEDRVKSEHGRRKSETIVIQTHWANDSEGT